MFVSSQSDCKDAVRQQRELRWGGRTLVGGTEKLMIVALRLVSMHSLPSLELLWFREPLMLLVDCWRQDSDLPLVGCNSLWKLLRARARCIPEDHGQPFGASFTAQCWV